MESEHVPRSAERADVPGMYGRIDVPEVPFIGRKLAVGLHVPLSRQQVELLFGECWINHGERNAVESRVPCSEERIFPPAKANSVPDTTCAGLIAYLSGIDKMSAMCRCFQSWRTLSQKTTTGD